MNKSGNWMLVESSLLLFPLLFPIYSLEHTKMDIYFFQPERYERMYNCNLYSVDQIPLEQRQHVGLGLTWIGLTTISQFLYVPCMFSIYKHIDNPCYALMFYIGFVDIITLTMNGWLTGYFGIIGMMFCMNPKLNYFVSCFALSCWFAESAAEIILAFNRCLELWSSEKAAKLFSGKKIWFWIIFPTIYGLSFGCFSRAFAFNSLYFSWFSYPHAGYLEATDISEYLNVAHSIHNHVILIALFLIYSIFCVLLLIKSRASGHSDSGPSYSQKKIFFQVMVISGVNAIAASVFVYMQYFQLSPFIIILGSFCWLCAHGLPPFIYLLMNKTIRKDCQRMLLGILGRDYNPTNTIHPSADLSKQQMSKRIATGTKQQEEEEKKAVEVSD